MRQRFHGSEITRQPPRVGARRIGVGFAGDFHDADDGQFLLAVIKENLVALVHFRKVFAGGGTADAAQRERAALDDVLPRCAKGGKLHKPMAQIRAV